MQILSKIRDSRNKHNRLSDYTFKLIKERLETEVRSERHRQIDKQVKRSIRRDLRNYNCHVVRVAIENNKSLKVARQGISGGRCLINSLTDCEGIK